MNPVLQYKLNELEQAKDYECWYLVKQPTAFNGLCYLVSFLKEYKDRGMTGNLQNFISRKIGETNAAKPGMELSDNYRALRVAAFFGLIVMPSKKYDEAKITETFEEINQRCFGEFEKTDLYQDIIERQIEKMFISSAVDEEYKGIRKEYRLYPVMLLYKILLELGRSTGEYSISMTEYRYLVATTKTFEGFLDTLLYIKLLREETDLSAHIKFEQYKDKFDNRLIQALKQLPALTVGRDGIRLKEDAVGETAEKVFLFEENPDIFATDNYQGFLGSAKSLFELRKSNASGAYAVSDDAEAFRAGDVPDAGGASDAAGESGSCAAGGIDESRRIEGGANILLYGVPGSGKSWTIEHEYCDDETKTERVVFHPEYSSADFVGQILPVLSSEDKTVTYEFSAGPFTNIMREAYLHPEQKYALIIEEINRGNAPAVFGDIFQLLDRAGREKTVRGVTYPAGTSEYEIINGHVAKIVYGQEKHPVRIPSNLTILGTMNTSDQNVFTLDTAFQRRWRMHMVENDFHNVRFSLSHAEILDTGVTWQQFCETINKKILENKAKIVSAEDKRLGVYFIHEDDLKFDGRALPLTGYDTVFEEYDELISHETLGDITDGQRRRLKDVREALLHNRIFPEKVMKYLWDDALKFNPEILFDVRSMDSLEKVIHTFVYGKGENRFRIFNETIRGLLYPSFR